MHPEKERGRGGDEERLRQCGYMGGRGKIEKEKREKMEKERRKGLSKGKR